MSEVVKSPVLGKESKDITHGDLRKIDLHGIISKSLDTFMKPFNGRKYENPLVAVAVTFNLTHQVSRFST